MQVKLVLLVMGSGGASILYSDATNHDIGELYMINDEMFCIKMWLHVTQSADFPPPTHDNWTRLFQSAAPVKTSIVFN